MSEKIVTTTKLDKHVADKLKRVSSILNISASEMMQTALEFYFTKSDVTKECQNVITKDAQYVKRMNEKHIGAGTIIGVGKR